MALYPTPGFASTPDIADPSGTIVGYWTDPPGVLLQFAQPARGTTLMVQWLVGPAFEQLLARFPDHPGIRVILDMRQMTGRAATARALLLQRAEALAKKIGHAVLIPSLHMGAAYVELVEATVTGLRAAGVNVDLTHSIEQVIAEHGVRAIRPSGQHPVPGAEAVSLAQAVKRAADRS